MLVVQKISIDKRGKVEMEMPRWPSSVEEALAIAGPADLVANQGERHVGISSGFSGIGTGIGTMFMFTSTSSDVDEVLKQPTHVSFQEYPADAPRLIALPLVAEVSAARDEVKYFEALIKQTPTGLMIRGDGTYRIFEPQDGCFGYTSSLQRVDPLQDCTVPVFDRRWGVSADGIPSLGTRLMSSLPMSGGEVYEVFFKHGTDTVSHIDRVDVRLSRCMGVFPDSPIEVGKSNLAAATARFDAAMTAAGF